MLLFQQMADTDLDLPPVEEEEDMPQPDALSDTFDDVPDDVPLVEVGKHEKGTGQTQRKSRNP